MSKYYFTVWMPSLDKSVLKEYKTLSEAQRKKNYYQRRYRQVSAIRKR